MTPLATMLAGKSPDDLVELSHFNREHLSNAVRLLSGQSIQALEIGCYKGVTTKWLLDHGVTRVDVVDPFKGGAELGDIDLRPAFEETVKEYRHNVVAHVGESAVILPKLLVAGHVYDLIYVDGSHDSRDVLMDAVLGFRLLRVGGVMVFDDFLWEFHQVKERNPGPAIEAFCRIYQANLQRLLSGYQLSVRKVKS